MIAALDDRIFRIGPDNAANLFAADSSYYDNPHCVTRAEVLEAIDALLDGADIAPYEALQGR